MKQKRFIGCCGAYCKSCQEYVQGMCKGCKLGFDTGERDIQKAKCKIKLCCFRDHGFDTCADCPRFESCDILGVWYAKKGYKYKKYKESIEFIKKNGYASFIKAAKDWRNAYGKLTPSHMTKGIKTSLIAPCGMNCGICYAYLREKNPCPGCRYFNAPEPVSIAGCKIRNCSVIQKDKIKYCFECDDFPCKNLKHLDKRYRTKYHMSEIENLEYIRKNGIRKFVKKEKTRWTCSICGGTICVHKQKCSACGKEKKEHSTLK